MSGNPAARPGTGPTARRPRSAPIRGLVFDKDGTLFDFRRTWSEWSGDFILDISGGDGDVCRALAEVLGYDLEGRRFRKHSLVIAGTTGMVVEAICSVLTDAAPAEMRRRLTRSAAAAEQVPAIPLAPFLTGLASGGHVLGLATNDSEASARAHLARAGILSCFDFVAGYDSGHGAKPAPGMLLAFCRQTGLSPEECLMIGDSAHDLASGLAAGMGTVGVLTGMAEREELSPLAGVVLKDIGALPAWLDLRKSGQATTRHPTQPG